MYILKNGFANVFGFNIFFFPFWTGEHMDVKNLKEDGDWIVCFCAFDVLYLNGSVLTNLPLEERLEKLKGVLSPLEGRVIITSRSKVTSK